MTYTSLDDCLKVLGTKAYPPEDDDRLYCPATWDPHLCWPPTLATNISMQHCPDINGLDTAKFAFRVCGANGVWEGYSSKLQIPGWTNFTGCTTDFVRQMNEKYLNNKSRQEKEVFRKILVGTRIMEYVGLSLSLVLLCIALFIFTYFRSLKCNRTWIHRNLFAAIIIQVLVRLIIYMDREIGYVIANHAPGVCETLYSILEYTKTVVFMWMLLEGVYLHNMIVVTVFSGKPNYIIYCLIAWGFPMLVTIAWVIAMLQLETRDKCFYGYYESLNIWILETPRVTVLIVNFLFLLNIIRVLVTKLRDSNSTESQQVRKAVKATIMLLPLLGISNFVVMIEPSQDSVVKFGVWSFIAHFLITFQGFFIAVFYCFLNTEVRMTVKKRWKRWRSTCRGGGTSGRRRLSRSLSLFTSFSEVPTSSSQQTQSRTPTSNGYVIPLLRDILARGESCI